jgi:NTE family protein
MRKFLMFFVAALLFSVQLFAQKPKGGIGLALAGGGAKGLAHIGILKAIDSAELNIDYLTGTSMGSIVGGLYAAGYSGDSIEYIARHINWGTLLSNSIPMTSYIMEEKTEYGKYAVELPIKGGKVSLPSGFLESQELWLTLEKYFYPVSNISDFSKLSIPYVCIGTDLATGESVVLNRGSLVRAIRSSMAIPGAFSPVEWEGRRLVDGGVTRNFPVKDLKDMGATYTIGVSVSTPIKNVEELDNVATVLSQVIFLNENNDRIIESAITDLLINVPMGDFTSASFDDGDAIIELGIAEGRKFYPYFKHLADSLKTNDPNYVFRKNRLQEFNGFQFKKITVEGIDNKTKKAFLEQTGVDTSKVYTSDKLERESRQAFAYRMYKSISYEVRDDSSGGHELLYKIKPESPVVMKVGISQNNFTGFGVHLNVTARNMLSKFSRTMATVNLGENFRAMAEHLQMFGYSRPWSNKLQVYTEFQDVPVYTNFVRTGQYKLKYLTIDNRFQISSKQRSAGGIGMQWENIAAKPQILTGTYFSGHNNYFHLYGFWQRNTLNKPQYAHKGMVVELKGGAVLGVNPDFQVYEDGNLVGEIDKQLIPWGNYARATANFYSVTPIHKRWAWINRIQGGANFSENSSLLNGFYAGGMNPTFRNQIMFVGLQEGEVDAESMAAVQTGLRYNPFASFYATAQIGYLTYDFVKKNVDGGRTESAWGTGITVAYDLPIGPIEFTMMFSNKTQGLRTYFNFGFPFRL